MTTISFKHFFDRVLVATPITTQTSLAKALGVNRSAITQAKVRDAVPQKWILNLSRKYALCADWLEFGTGVPHAKKKQPTSALEMATGKKLSLVLHQEQSTFEPLVLDIPKVTARLCAGGGSFEVEAHSTESYSLPYKWLSRMGTPSAMVFMEVVGDSMEPTIFCGDMVLIDQAATTLNKKSIFAIGYEDSIFIKRVARHPGGVDLLSDNSNYSSIHISGEEQNSFRVLGTVVWLCRDCRSI